MHEKRKVVVVEARDWCLHHMGRATDKFEAITGWVVGVLLEDNEDRVVVAHALFDDEGVRDVTAIPRECVIHITVTNMEV
jgi:hypothetical protein